MMMWIITIIASCSSSRARRRVAPLGLPSSPLGVSVRAIPKKMAKKITCSMLPLARASKGFVGMIWRRLSIMEGALVALAAFEEAAPWYSERRRARASGSTKAPGLRVCAQVSPMMTAMAVVAR